MFSAVPIASFISSDCFQTDLPFTSRTMYSVQPTLFELHFWLAIAPFQHGDLLLSLFCQLLSHKTTCSFHLYPSVCIEWAGRLSQWVTTTVWWWSLCCFLLKGRACSVPVTREVKYDGGVILSRFVKLQPVGRFLCKDQFSSVLQN